MQKVVLLETNKPLGHMTDGHWTYSIEGEYYWMLPLGQDTSYTIQGLQDFPEDYLHDAGSYTKLASIYDFVGVMYWDCFWG